MKDLILMLICLGVLVWVIATMPPSKQYTVKITFCDTRPPEVINVWSLSEPSNRDISNSGRESAVPTYEGRLNVCEVKTLKQLSK